MTPSSGSVEPAEENWTTSGAGPLIGVADPTATGGRFATFGTVTDTCAERVAPSESVTVSVAT